MKSKGFFIAAALLCSWTLSATAQVHRCSDAKGHLTYSDQPCAADQAAAQLEQRKPAETVQQERAEAAQARQRNALQSTEPPVPGVSSRSGTAMAPITVAQNRPDCRAAQKELEFVSSIRTLSDTEKRSRMNGAISGVNAACGTNTPLLQEPPPRVVRQIVITRCEDKFCYDEQGAAYGRNGSNVLAAPDGQMCTGVGKTWTCQ